MTYALITPALSCSYAPVSPVQTTPGRQRSPAVRVGPGDAGVPFGLAGNQWRFVPPTVAGLPATRDRRRVDRAPPRAW